MVSVSSQQPEVSLDDTDEGYIVVNCGFAEVDGGNSFVYVIDRLSDFSGKMEADDIRRHQLAGLLKINEPVSNAPITMNRCFL